MLFLSLVQFVAIALLLAFALTQVILPMLKGTPLFPMFRKSRNELESKASELRGELEDQELAKEVSKLEKKLGKSE